MSVVYMIMGNFDTALSCLNDAMEVTDQNALIYFRRSQVFNKKKKKFFLIFYLNLGIKFKKRFVNRTIAASKARY